MHKYAAWVSYEGTNYCGWQKQTKTRAHSVQGRIEGALLQMTGERVPVVGSGRTDAGVHAIGQVAHFVLRNKDWEPEILFNGLNSMLRSSIQLLGVRRVPLDFHAQKSALRKQYCYFFQQGSCALPHLEPYSWWIRKRLDLKAMNEALGYLVGEKDFRPFQASGAKPGPTVRRILSACVATEEVQFPAAQASGAHFVSFRVVGTGFLKQMVRGIAGTLLQVGEGRRPPDCVREILETQDRSLVGPTAPARALWLEKVWYSEHFGMNEPQLTRDFRD